jgi:hypothetical protein
MPFWLGLIDIILPVIPEWIECSVARKVSEAAECPVLIVPLV